MKLDLMNTAMQTACILELTGHYLLRWGGGGGGVVQADSGLGTLS